MDCADVEASFVSPRVDFVLVGVRSEELFAESHVRGAINIRVPNTTDDQLKAFAANALFVPYCAGPHCKGANKAAIRTAEMGRSFKKMIGGVTGWLDDGFSLVEGNESPDKRNHPR